MRRQRRDAVYILKFRAAGKQRVYTIGQHGSPWTVDTARIEAKRLLGELAKGTDPSLLRDKMRPDVQIVRGPLHKRGFGPS